jgi:hypothetical protein
VAFDSFRQKIRRKLGAMTYLLFLHTTRSSQNIFIPPEAYCKPVKTQGLILHFFLANMIKGAGKINKFEGTPIPIVRILSIND